jgi:hypothetical protein
MHHGEVFYLKGESYRLKGKKKYLEGNTTSKDFQLEMVTDRENKE